MCSQGDSNLEVFSSSSSNLQHPGDLEGQDSIAVLDWVWVSWVSYATLACLSVPLCKLGLTVPHRVSGGLNELMHVDPSKQCLARVTQYSLVTQPGPGFQGTSLLLRFSFQGLGSALAPLLVRLTAL